MRILPLCAATALSLLVGCGGGGDGGSPTTPVVDNTPSTLTLAPSAPLALTSGQSSTLTATVTAKDGRSLGAGGVAWSSGNTNVASVSGGVVSALKVGSTTITASIGTLTASVSVTVSIGPAASLGIRTQPAGGAIGGALPSQPVIEIRDAGGNVVTTSTAAVTVAIASGGGTLGGTTVVNAVAGVATFSGLAIAGAAGDRTLLFTSPTLASVTSGAVTMTPPLTPVIVVDNPTVGITAARGTNPAASRINITNGGSQPLTGLTLDAVSYDAGQVAGWLGASLSTTTAPAVLTLAVNVAGLAEGKYAATVRVNAQGASNSPLPITVTLTINPSYTISYGTATEKVRIVDVGGSFLPTIRIAEANGTPVPGVTVDYAVRSASTMSVASDGRITARAPGDGWVVASTSFTRDSVFIIVPQSATAPMMRTNLTNYSARIGDTVFVTILLDTRSTTVGAASMAVDLSIGLVTALFDTPAGPPVPIVNNSSSGILRISVGSATGMTGSVPVLTLKIIGRGATAGWLYLYALDVAGVDGSNLTTQTSSTRVPIIIR